MIHLIKPGMMVQLIQDNIMTKHIGLIVGRCITSNSIETFVILCKNLDSDTPRIILTQKPWFHLSTYLCDI